MNMSSEEKARLVRAIYKFTEAIAPLAGARTEEELESFMANNLPEPAGLGTDGTCWTKEEHRAYAAAVCKNITFTLRKAERKAKE